MQATPPPAGFSYNQTGTNHNFAASITICSQCHTGLNGLALQGSTELMLEDLNKAVGAAAVTKLNGLGSIIVSPIEPETEREASGDITINTVADPVTDVQIAAGSRLTFKIVLTTPIDITYVNDDSTTETVTTNTFDVQLEFLRDGTDTVVYALSGNMVRACWNYLLIKQDLSEGVHNPSFVSNVLLTTTGKDLSF
jgi:hypothetical protein